MFCDHKKVKYHENMIIGEWQRSIIGKESNIKSTRKHHCLLRNSLGSAILYSELHWGKETPEAIAEGQS